MGQEFSAGGAITMSDRLLDKVKRAISIIDKAPANTHQKLLFVSIIATSQVNYGPLVEQTSGKNYIEKY